MPVLRLKRNQVIFWASCIVLRCIFAYFLPITNDEAYYWDWGQNLQLSYMDHPPFVAWLSFLSDLIASDLGNLKARLMVIVCHFFSTVFILGAIQSVHQNSQKATWGALILTQLIPGLNFLGMALLPDAGLLLSLSAALHLSMQMSFGGKAMTLIRGVIIGIIGGLAICAKYHAFVILPGIAAATIWHRRSLGLPILVPKFYIALILGVVVGSFPVWLWNLQYDWISIRFQSDHGFGGLNFNPTFALRTMVGQWVFLSPVVWFLPLLLIFKELRKLLRKEGHKNWRHHRLLLVFIFLPLFGLLFVIAPFKQSLPHWVLPAYWCAIPFLSRSLRVLRRGVRIFTLSWAALFGVLLPLGLIATPVVDRILEKSGGNPKGISEVTLWQKMDPAIQQSYQQAKQIASESNGKCRPVLASLRWFWIAQIRYKFPDIEVVTLDLHHPSYYHYLDSSWMVPGCELVLVGDQRHFDPEKLGEWVEVLKQEPLEIPLHEKMPLYRWTTRIKKTVDGSSGLGLLYRW